MARIPGDDTRKLALWLHHCSSASLATSLARSVHEIFGCSGWVADYLQPADVASIRRRPEASGREAPQTPGHTCSAAR